MQVMMKVIYYENKIGLKFLLGYPVQSSFYFLFFFDITEEIKPVRKECIELKKRQTVFKREVKKVLMGV